MKPEANIVREKCVRFDRSGSRQDFRHFNRPKLLASLATGRDNGPILRSLGPLPRVRNGFSLVLLALTLAFVPATTAMASDAVRLQCSPRRFQVVPGEPIRLEMSVRAENAAPIRLHVPDDPLLMLRAIEKLPMQQTQEGVIVHQRVVIWQALEPGLVKMKSLSVETKGRKLLFPEITITIRDPGP